jgi:hypothetical protein
MSDDIPAGQMRSKCEACGVVSFFPIKFEVRPCPACGKPLTVFGADMVVTTTTPSYSAVLSLPEEPTK